MGGFKVLPDWFFWPRMGLVLVLLIEMLLMWLAGKYHSVWASWLIEKFWASRPVEQLGWDREWHELVELMPKLVERVQEFVETVIVAVVMAVVFVVSAAFANFVADSDALAGAVASAVAVAVLLSGTFRVVGTFAGTVVFVSAGAIADIGVSVSTIAILFVCSFAFYHAVSHLIKLEDTHFRGCFFWPVLLAFLLYAGLLLAVVYWPPQGSYVGHLSPNKRTLLFVSVVFLTCLPIINAFSDWLSVSFTRWLFGKYSQSDTPTLPWWWIVLDLLFTLLLCLGLYHSVIGLLSLMQASGWPVDVQQTVRAFNEQPLGGQSSWLTWLAITNFIPLGLHYVMIVWGIHTRRWGVPAHVSLYLRDLKAGKALSTTDARTLAMFLTWDRGMKVATMLLLIPSAYMLLQWLLHASLRVWL